MAATCRCSRFQTESAFFHLSQDSNSYATDCVLRNMYESVNSMQNQQFSYFVRSHQIVMNFSCRGKCRKLSDHSNLISFLWETFSTKLCVINDKWTSLRSVRMQRLGIIRYSCTSTNQNWIVVCESDFQATIAKSQPFVNKPTNFISDVAIKVKPQLINVMGKYVFMCFLLCRRNFRTPSENLFESNFMVTVVVLGPLRMVHLLGGRMEYGQTGRHS